MPSETPDADYFAARDAAQVGRGFEGHDALDPMKPSGHAYGIEVSTRLTSDYRQTHRKEAMDVKPKDVIDCLVGAGVKNWVLMGLHGYVGYLPMPRATQDVDVMVPYSQKTRAVKAITQKWPTLEMTELSQVVRFKDRGDLDQAGDPKPVIDIMLPFGPYQEQILKHHVVVDSATGNRLPTIEAAVVSKYAAVISPYRSFDKKEQDAVDLRRLIKANHQSIDHGSLVELAALVWENGGEEIERFIELALTDQPFR
jgi:hypothetical protein